MTALGSKDDAPALTPDELARFCDFFYRRTGMTFGESKRYYIERRIADRMAATGARAFRDYFARIRNDHRELQHAINAFTVNETYFYREPHQLRCLSRSLLPEVVAGKTPGDRVRVWSNPCSTGEEAYSVALWLLENWGMVDAYNIDIVGSDIDTVALEQARNGFYEQRSVSRLPSKVLGEYFEAVPAGGYRLIQDLRESVSFSGANLIDPRSMETQGTFEIIFCRNVLIYFDDASRRTAAELLYERLAPGGFLLLGHTESMARIDDRFMVRKFEDAIVYQRPEGS